MKKWIIPTVIFAVVFAVAFVACVISVIASLIAQTPVSPLPNRAAAELSEFSAYDKYRIDDYSVTADSKIKDLSYTDSHVFAVKYKNNVYFVYAYMFDSVDTARKYYSKHGNTAGERIHGEYLHQGLGLFGMSDAVYVSFYNNFAYKVCGGSTRDLLDLLNECSSQFSVDLSRIG